VREGKRVEVALLEGRAPGTGKGAIGRGWAEEGVWQRWFDGEGEEELSREGRSAVGERARAVSDSNSAKRIALAIRAITKLVTWCELDL